MNVLLIGLNHLHTKTSEAVAFYFAILFILLLEYIIS